LKLIRKQNSEKIDKAYARIKAAYDFDLVEEPPVLLGDFNYWVEGDLPGRIPNDYFTNPVSMLDFQIKKIEKHLENYDDDYVPFLMPWYGTTVVPSALGCEVYYPPGGDPTLVSSILTGPDQIVDLLKPDPYVDGQMPMVLETIDLMRSKTDLPVGITDAQGPLNIALSLAGVEQLFVWMYENHEAVHGLMDFATDVLIDWIQVQKVHANQPMKSGAFPHGILLPEGYGGVWLSDDDCVLISAEMYREFVVPYNGRVFEAFGGGTLHFCGTAEHQIENFLETPGLVGINAFCMGDFKQLAKMQVAFEDKVTLMACDFAPLDPNAYFKELFQVVSPRGLILANYIAATFALDNGKYQVIKRDPDVVAQSVWKAIQNNK
jgi:uroporphyrinogen-III decarboxylase